MSYVHTALGFLNKAKTNLKIDFAYNMTCAKTFKLNIKTMHIWHTHIQITACDGVTKHNKHNLK